MTIAVPDEQRARQIAGGVAHFADDIGRRVPAGIGVHHEHEADGERRAGDVAEVGGARRKRNRLPIAEAKAGDDEHDDENELESGPGIMVGAAETHAAQMHECRKPGDAQPEQQWRRSPG